MLKNQLIIKEREKMAYDKNIRNKFIEMCAKGNSLSEISRKLKVSLPTLNKWKEETGREVYEFKQMLRREREIEIEKMITERVKLINTELEKAFKALEKRSINKMKTKYLLYFIEKLDKEFDDPLLKDKIKPEQKKKMTVNVLDSKLKIIETKTTFESK